MTSTSPIQTIKKLAEAEQIPAFIVLIAKDSIRAERVISKIYGKSIFTKAKKIDCSVIKEKNWRVIEGDLLSMSLFAETKLFQVSNFNKLSKKITEQLLVILNNTPPGTSIILKTDRLNKNNAIRKLAEKNNCYIELAKFTSSELERWTKNEFVRNGINKTSNQVIQGIIEQAEEKPSVIAKLVEHAALYANADSFGMEDYKQLYTDAVNLRDFGLLDAIQQGNRYEAENLCSQLINQGRSPFMLLALIARTYAQYAKLIGLKALNYSDQKAQTELGIQNWLYKKHKAAVTKISARKIKLDLKAIAETDLRLKDKSLGNEAIFSELISRLCV